mmetsp:Transcript_24281/g.61532  ORF Transcript_24281/g.61532 Transcript_24281/m.61532 type:complete len:211 (+) Transcript_24281:1248-1880(+)
MPSLSPPDAGGGPPTPPPTPSSAGSHDSGGTRSATAATRSTASRHASSSPSPSAASPAAAVAPRWGEGFSAATDSLPPGLPLACGKKSASRAPSSSERRLSSSVSAPRTLAKDAQISRTNESGRGPTAAPVPPFGPVTATATVPFPSDARTECCPSLAFCSPSASPTLSRAAARAAAAEARRADARSRRVRTTRFRTEMPTSRRRVATSR